MCTALNIKSQNNVSFFGRNMDIAYDFNQTILVIPRDYTIENKVTKTITKNVRAIMGMGTIIDNHPVFADAMNEKGLACAGLNFPRYSYFEENKIEGKVNIAPYDFIQWVLSNHDTIEEVKKSILNLELVNIPINDRTPIAPLHWMVCDKMGNSIVVEKTKEKLAVYDNPVGVMTNNPSFDWHLTNLNEYINLTPNEPDEKIWSKQKLTPLGVGLGSFGIPGDFASVSRFVRIAYIRESMPPVESDISAVTQFLHMLDYVKMVKGAVVNKEGNLELTKYSSCMDQENCIYYYRTYGNNRINAIKLKEEYKTLKEIKIYPYIDNQDINYIN